MFECASVLLAEMHINRDIMVPFKRYNRKLMKLYAFSL